MKWMTVEEIDIEKVVTEETANIRRTDIQRVILIIIRKLVKSLNEVSDTIEGMKTDRKMGPNIEIMDRIKKMVVDEEDMSQEVRVAAEVEVATDFHILRVQDVTTKTVLKEKSKKWPKMIPNLKKEFNTKIV